MLQPSSTLAAQERRRLQREVGSGTSEAPRKPLGRFRKSTQYAGAPTMLRSYGVYPIGVRYESNEESVSILTFDALDLYYAANERDYPLIVILYTAGMFTG